MTNTQTNDSVSSIMIFSFIDFPSRNKTLVFVLIHLNRFCFSSGEKKQTDFWDFSLSRDLRSTSSHPLFHQNISLDVINWMMLFSFVDQSFNWRWLTSDTGSSLWTFSSFTDILFPVRFSRKMIVYLWLNDLVYAMSTWLSSSHSFPWSLIIDKTDERKRRTDRHWM